MKGFAVLGRRLYGKGSILLFDIKVALRGIWDLHVDSLYHVFGSCSYRTRILEQSARGTAHGHYLLPYFLCFVKLYLLSCYHFSMLIRNWDP